MDERRLELKVGALAALALVIGIALVVALTGVARGHVFRLTADFSYAGGLPAGAAVKIAGVKVGRVRDVLFRADAHDETGKPLPVRLELEIDRSAAPALRPDATASVGMQGALGESYIELQPGTKPGTLPENATIRGIDPPRLDVLLAKAAAALEGAANDDALHTFLYEVAQLAHTVNGAFTNNKEQVVQALQDAMAIISDARGAVGDLKVASKQAAVLLSSPEVKQIVSDFSTTARTAKTELPGLLHDTHALVARLEKTTDSIGPDDVQKVRETLARYDALGSQLQKVSGEADALLSSIQRGEGTLGKMAKDPQVFDDLRALLADLKAKPWKLVWKN